MEWVWSGMQMAAKRHCAETELEGRGNASVNPCRYEVLGNYIFSIFIYVMVIFPSSNNYLLQPNWC